jgi:DNA-binding NarL/FixJ family response regulator
MERARQGASARQLHWTFTPDMARALAVAGETAELRRWSDAVASLTTGSADHPHNRSAGLLCQGLALIGEGRHDDAVVCLEEAAGMYATLPCPAREIEARLALAEAHLGRGAVPSAVEAASQAQRLARDHGIEQLMPEVMAMLRRAGVRVAGRRGAAAELPGGLSERELQVAALVAQGLSNAEIGRRLFLSELTVRNHVSNVLAKLELRTRAEVARWMAENGLLDAVDARTR